MAYDAQGNPTTYMGKSLTWEKGRQLKAFGGNIYTYNANGIRTGKTVGGVQHTYTLDGTRIQRETWDGNTLIPLYDNEDAVCGVIYNGTPYYFQKNLQGDIIAITDQNAETVARYTYDAWGVCTITADTSTDSIAAVNPFRYRGYYYDTEIGLYYLQSRYYDPTVGRFLNADEAIFALLIEKTSQTNSFYYCYNQPVNSMDACGYMALEGVASGFIASYGTAYAGAALGALVAKITTFVSMIAPYLLIAVLAIAALLLIYYAIKGVGTQRTKTLSDVKVKVQRGKHYHLAYISRFGELIKIGKKMTFEQALAALGISGATNSISQRFVYNKNRSSSAQRQLEHRGNWGIYADSQYAAKALAVVFGFAARPEVHVSGMYGHYHDQTHTFHIWYGGKITY